MGHDEPVSRSLQRAALQGAAAMSARLANNRFDAPAFWRRSNRSVSCDWKELDMVLEMTRTQVGCLVSLAAVAIWSSGCNRAALRLPGASLAFPETPTYYRAKAHHPYTVVVLAPVDRRPEHYGERIAGTRWKGCCTDALWGGDASALIQKRLVSELEASALFSSVATTLTRPDDLVMRTEIHAFCSQVVGVVFLRVAGITALKVSLEQNGKVLFDHKFEKVVTDADKEYSGSQVTFIEQAMKVTMADSLRELIKEMLSQLDVEAATWSRAAANQSPEPTAPRAGARNPLARVYR
ncbi:MAG: hypothetical protein KatS3mg077_2247 [Candidatus Binatia bacterium]|nr:MAG: hypothetical protein KatS3mg077_2247 [Candidatus Binatia bacterium]